MFYPEGPCENVWGPHENISPGPAVALDGLVCNPSRCPNSSTQIMAHYWQYRQFFFYKSSTVVQTQHDHTLHGMYLTRSGYAHKVAVCNTVYEHCGWCHQWTNNCACSDEENSNTYL